jgi:hypothetical protein
MKRPPRTSVPESRNIIICLILAQWFAEHHLEHLQQYEFLTLYNSIYSARQTQSSMDMLMRGGNVEVEVARRGGELELFKQLWVRKNHEITHFQRLFWMMHYSRGKMIFWGKGQEDELLVEIKTIHHFGALPKMRLFTKLLSLPQQWVDPAANDLFQ